MDVTTAMVGAVNSSSSAIQQAIAIQMLKMSQIPEKQAAQLIAGAVASDDYSFSVYV